MIKAQFLPAILLTLVLSILTGAIFPVAQWTIAQVFFPHNANGSLIEKHGKLIGSELIGRNFNSPRYFHSRPSAAGSGYDPLSSGGTNLGPTSKKLFRGLPDDPATADVNESYDGVETLAKAYREKNGLSPSELLPVDAVTRSASGLDPHISLKNARLQSGRVARERNLNIDNVNALIQELSEGRFLAVFGEPRINVFKLNLALDTLS